MKNYLLILFLCLLASRVFAEGTKEIKPDSTLPASFLLDSTYTFFGQYKAKPEEQIKIRIARIGEKIYFGMNNITDKSEGGKFVKNLHFRILSPSGKIVYSSVMPDSLEPGNIATYAQAIAGPAQLGNPGGYDALSIVADTIGDYVIEFDSDDIKKISNVRLNLQYFDVTVADLANKPVTGRLHSQGWQISTSDYEYPFLGKVYTYDGGSAIYKVNFNNMRPWVFVVNFNSKGTGNGDPTNFLTDRQSKIGKFTNPEYEVFLNPPDPLLYPVTSKNVHLYGDLKKLNCSITEFCYSTDSPGFLEGFLDFNNNGLYDPSSGEVYFGHYFDKAMDTVCIPWDGKDNQGALVTKSGFKILSNFGFGITHLPVFDVENNNFGLIVDRISPPGGQRPALFWDDTNIPPNSIGPDNRFNISGCTNPSGCHTWNWNAEKKDDAVTDYGNNNTINTWWYSSIVFDTLVYNVPVPEQVSLSFSSSTLVNKDTAVCLGDSLSFFVFNDGNHFNSAKYKYEWSYNGAALNPDIREQRQKIIAAAEIVVTASTKSGPLCISQDTLHVKVINPVTISSSITTVCSPNPGSITVSVTSASPNAAFRWKEFPLVKSGSLNDLSPGQYHLQVSETFSGYCGVDSTFTIPAVPGISINKVIVQPLNCNNSGATGSASVEMKDPLKQYEYSWDNGPFSGLASMNGFSIGAHMVKVRDKLQPLCTDDKTFTISLIPLSHSIVKKEEICSGKQGGIALNFPLSNVNISWNGVPDGPAIKSQLSAGSYQVQVVSSSSGACKFDTTIQILNTGVAPQADFSIDPPASDSFEIGEKVVFNNLSGNVSTSNWKFGDGSASTDFNTSHSFVSAGKFIVELKVADANGCTGTITRSIFIATVKPCGPALPNAFSPNEDKINDDIGILGLGDNLDLKIFNRWGEVIFRTEGSVVIDCKRWNGMYREQQVPIGVYPYLLEYDCPDKQKNTKRYKKLGDITLVR